MQFDNRQFSYKELKAITNSFEKSIGRGGFGVVYLGYLEDGTPVAVKTRSESSSQGVNEFLAEVRFLPAPLLSFLCMLYFSLLSSSNQFTQIISPFCQTLWSLTDRTTLNCISGSASDKSSSQELGESGWPL